MGVQHLDAVLGHGMGCQGLLGITASLHKQCPWVFPLVPVFMCQLAFTTSQLGTGHGNERLGQGHAVPVPGGGVANRASLGSDLALWMGSILVELRPAGRWIRRGSVAPGSHARERLVLVVRTTGSFFPGSVPRAV